ncbi:restriction endonuclease subunit S [Salibaculum griseiflavum]|uniref:Type I restriction modification DNA specificity domain-containing protein n=1 Tax=Salibaculum griseiflavum TaxID=1914409 RepID=A0A2V1P670_9RHOB|nr:restriction endonuclease subunit S [Salibaculum griseiflavum]PWG16732.1 hypothetical protein DFK10_10470 [Salibaculum griseiflavum]
MSAVPKLRFPEFEGDWDENSLGEICKFSQGVQVGIEHQGFVDDANAVRFIRIVDYMRSSEVPRFINISYAKKGRVSLSDIVMVRYGEPGMLCRGIEGVIANNLFKITPKPSLLDDFLFHGLSRERIKNEIRARSASTSMAAINFSSLSSLLLMNPSLPEQQKIASFLSSVDKKIDLLRQKKDALELYKKGLMQKIFSQEIRFKQDDGSDFPDWEEVALGEACFIKAGDYLAKNDYKNGEFSVEGAGSTMGRHSKGNFKGPTTVIGKVGTVGKPRFFPRGCWVNNNAAAVLPKEGFKADFLFIVFTFLDWSSVTAQTAQPFLLNDDLLGKKFRFPAEPEQERIASAFLAVSSKLALLQKTINTFETYKKGLLQQMFV